MKGTAILFGKNVRALRRAAHLTQQSLGELLGYSGKSVSKWEKGEAYPPTELLPALSRALGVGIEALFAAHVPPRFFLGIDGGGTKCDYLLTDEGGKPIASHTGASVALSAVGPRAACETLREGILRVCGEVPLSQVGVFAGLAGGSTAEYAEPLLAFLRDMGFASVHCGSDAKNALCAALGEGDGVIAIMGTGSAVFSTRSGVDTRYGGYGHLLGDPASGYAFGRAVIASALEHADTSGTPTRMYALLCEETGKQPLELIAPVYEGGKKYVASFAPLFFQAVREGDALACRLFEEELAHLAAQIRAALAPLGARVPVVLCGGLSREAELILPILEKYLDGCDYSEIRTLNKTCVQGAAAYARRLG